MRRQWALFLVVLAAAALIVYLCYAVMWGF